MFSFFESAMQLVEDSVEIIVKPVEVVIDLADAAVKPAAEAFTDLSNDIKSLKQ